MGILNETTARAHGAVDQMAAHPLQSLGMELAAGYLISRLTR
jgi:hypothetical protein